MTSTVGNESASPAIAAGRSEGGKRVNQSEETERRAAARIEAAGFARHSCHRLQRREAASSKKRAIFDFIDKFKIYRKDHANSETANSSK